MSFKPLEPKPDFPKLEKEILGFWEKNKIVAKYLRRNEKSEKRFRFLDGPITANNPMGVHHAWGRTYKDLWQRYFTMRGFKQRYQNGFDCQGLWVEVEVEKELGFRNKKDIEKYGIDRFVKKCQERALKYAKIQTEQSKRLGYFMDWDNSYYTMSDENNYAIWHFLKTCREKGYLYKGRDSVPWCPRCGTAISQHEILTEEYKEISHTSAYVKFPITSKGDWQDKNLLIWTTTPWTLPSNAATAADPKMTYVEFETENAKDIIIMAENRIEAILGKDWKSKGAVLRKFEGRELIGLNYRGRFDDLESVRNNLSDYVPRVIAADGRNIVISAEEGTGLVHIAPGAGAEDFAISKTEKLPVIASIDENGNFLTGFGKYSGKFASEVSQEVINDLGNALFKKEEYRHRYPTCWRCKTELLFRIVDEWYIAMDRLPNPKLRKKTLRQQLIEIAKKINWLPKWGLDRELDWLNNMRDWLISKKRYWGLSLPIWECQCGNFEVIGSKEELKKKAVAGWEKFEGNSPHRPWVDKVKIKCSECGKTTERIPDVGNPWLDAGIVPFSTLGYFQNRKYWQDWFPADFITESFPGQFKNWFYALLVMSAVLENTNPFKAVLGFASVKDEKGEEMHKSKGNAIWFDDAAEKIGVDGMRWLYASANPELNLNFGYGAIEITQRRFFMILWNVANFFITYANVDKWRPNLSDKRHITCSKVLDRWILAKLNVVIKSVTESMERYDAKKASNEIERFVIEDLSTWYLQNTRKRRDQEFYNALYYMLITVVKILSPFVPFISEKLYQHLALDSQVDSAHLEDWPVCEENFIDNRLIKEVENDRKLVELGNSIRARERIKVRQPLSLALIKSKKKWSEERKELLRNKINVENIKIMSNPPKDICKGLLKAEDKDLAIYLDVRITPELKEKGITRDLIREIQNQRKKAGLSPGERVDLTVTLPEDIISVVKKNQKVIIQETTVNKISIIAGDKITVDFKK